MLREDSIILSSQDQRTQIHCQITPDSVVLQTPIYRNCLTDSVLTPHLTKKATFGNIENLLSVNKFAGLSVLVHSDERKTEICKEVGKKLTQQDLQKKPTGKHFYRHSTFGDCVLNKIVEEDGFPILYEQTA